MTLKQFIDHEYQRRRPFRWFCARRLTEEQIEALIAWHDQPIDERPDRPVGFDPITWFLIAKLLIELIALWYRIQEST